MAGYYWAVVEYDEKDIAAVNNGVTFRVSKCKIIEIQDPDGLDPDKLLSFINDGA